MVLRRRSVDRRYQIGDRIATGGMSEIYEASAAELENRRLAIKRLIVPDGDEESEARFLREAAIVAALDHPNVVEVLDAGRYGTDYVLVLEYIEGLSLSEILRELTQRGTVLDVDIACGIVGQVARGLGHAHERSLPDGGPLHIVHRDVSPDNILVGVDGIPKLIDFGVATLEGHDLTAPGVVRGRPRYLAPEQARAEKVDARTDIFALGAVAFELLTGEPLYPGDNETAMLWRVQLGQFEPIGPRLAGIDPDLVAIVERATQPNRDDRFGSARQFERQLDRFRAARGLRVDSSALAQVVKELLPKVEAERRSRAAGRSGELCRSLLILPADPSDKSGSTDPRLAAFAGPPTRTSDPSEPGPARKRRLERLRRPVSPKIERPASLGVPPGRAPRERVRSVIAAMREGRVGALFLLGAVVGGLAVIAALILRYG